MMGPVSVAPPYAVVESTLKHGAPALVRGFGRAFGLGQAEQTALANGAVPWWLYLVFGTAAGVVLGVQLQKRYPGYASYVGGGR